MSREVTCTNCGWVHVGLQLKMDMLNDPNTYRQTCFRCGHKEFRESKPEDAPRGCTLQAVYIPLADIRE